MCVVVIPFHFEPNAPDSLALLRPTLGLLCLHPTIKWNCIFHRAIYLQRTIHNSAPGKLGEDESMKSNLGPWVVSKNLQSQILLMNLNIFQKRTKQNIAPGKIWTICIFKSNQYDIVFIQDDMFYKPYMLLFNTFKQVKIVLSFKCGC